jgi:hypothetical protein
LDPDLDPDPDPDPYSDSLEMLNPYPDLYSMNPDLQHCCFLSKTKHVFCFGQGVVYLSEIQTVEDLKELSAKQAKEILAMNR